MSVRVINGGIAMRIRVANNRAIHHPFPASDIQKKNKALFIVNYRVEFREKRVGWIDGLTCARLSKVCHRRSRLGMYVQHVSG